MATPIVGWTLLKFGRRNYIRLGYFITAISMGAFGSLPYVTSKEMFVAISIVGRVLQGIGSATLSVSMVAVVSILFPDNLEENIGKIEATGGIGLTLGPIVGSVLYTVGGFSTVFFV